MAQVHYAFSYFTLQSKNGVHGSEDTNNISSMTESLKDMEKRYDEESGKPIAQQSMKALRRRNRRAHRRSANIVCSCLVLVILCAVFECFALFNIEFCDGEDLMFLYWGFWCKLNSPPISQYFSLKDMQADITKPFSRWVASLPSSASQSNSGSSSAPSRTPLGPLHSAHQSSYSLPSAGLSSMERRGYGVRSRDVRR